MIEGKECITEWKERITEWNDHMTECKGRTIKWKERITEWKECIIKWKEHIKTIMEQIWFAHKAVSTFHKCQMNTLKVTEGLIKQCTVKELSKYVVRVSRKHFFEFFTVLGLDTLSKFRLTVPWNRHWNTISRRLWRIKVCYDLFNDVASLK